MKTATKRGTRERCLRLVQRKWNRQPTYRENPKALTDSEKKAVHELNKAKRARVEAIKLELQPFGWDKTWVQLLKMGRFVVDVDGAPSALDELRKSVEAAERMQELREEKAGLEAEMKESSGKTYSHRCEVGYLSTMPTLGSVNHIVACGDTWDEVLSKLESGDL